MLTNWLVTLRLTSNTSIGIPSVKGKTNRISLLSKGDMVMVWLSLKMSRLRSSMVSLQMYSPKLRKLRSLYLRSQLCLWATFTFQMRSYKMMKGLNPSKAFGPNELHPRVLKEFAVELGPVFAHLFQQYVDKGEISKEWSFANICPLYKKGDWALPSRYCSGSLSVSRTSSWCRLYFISFGIIEPILIILNIEYCLSRR